MAGRRRLGPAQTLSTHPTGFPTNRERESAESRLDETNSEA